MTAADRLVIIPAYNEEATIEQVVHGALPHARVCVVDDGSTDRTGAIASSIPDVHVISHAANTHIARAVLDGMAYALAEGFRYAVTLDAGLSHDPGELPRFFTSEPAALVIGTRTGSTYRAPRARRALSRCGTALVNLALRGDPRDGPRRLADCTSGYRRYSREAMQLLLATPLRSRAFGFVFESLAVISAAGLPIREVQISYRFSRSSLTPHAIAEAAGVWLHLAATRLVTQVAG
jgi:dolichol-phosphate mannosyltransferase